MADIEITTEQVEQITTDGDTIKVRSVSVADQIAADKYNRAQRAQVFTLHRRLRRKI